MNNTRRTELLRIAAALREINVPEFRTSLERSKEDIEVMKEEEQEYFDNMPENFQTGDKGQTAEAAISNIEEAISKLEELIELLDAVDEAAEFLNSAAE